MSGKESTLSERLRQEVEYDEPNGPREITFGRVFAEAAELIDAQAARIAELEAKIACIGTDDQWRQREGETQKALQALGEEFGIWGEPRVDGLRRVLTAYRSLSHLLAEAKEVLRGVITSRLKPDFDRARSLLSKLEELK